MKQEYYKSKKYTFVIFKISNEIFGVDVKNILEVLDSQDITPIPQTPDYIEGIINYRGEILPVINTFKKFGLEDVSEDNKRVILVLDIEINDKQLIIGALANKVKDVITVDEKEIQEVPDIGINYNTAYLEGAVKTPEGFMLVLNTKKVFSVDEISLIEKSVKVDEVKSANVDLEIEDE